MSLTDGKVHINAFMSLPLTGGGPSYTCEKVLTEMMDEQTQIKLYTPADKREQANGGVDVIAAVPRQARKVPFRIVTHVGTPLAERKFVAACRKDKESVAYLWGDVTLSLVRRLKEAGLTIVREKYNCSKRVARDILIDAYSKLDATEKFPSQYYTDTLIDEENEVLANSDFVVAPSPMVAQSLVEVGVADGKIVPASYGYDPVRLNTDERALQPIAGPTFLFAGFICVRKGAHILLEAWRRSSIAGKLVLVGKIEPLIAERYGDVLAMPSVEHHAFSFNIASYFRSASYFIFPTLEEGSPLVTYEATYCNLPAIVSPMGAGEIIRDGVEGSVVASDEIEDWVDALRFAAQEFADGKHKVKAAAAHMRALEFTWDKVGTRRRELLRRALLNTAPSARIPAAG